MEMFFQITKIYTYLAKGMGRIYIVQFTLASLSLFALSKQ